MPNTAPVLDGLDAQRTFLESDVNGTPQVLDAGVTFTDAENNFFLPGFGQLTVAGGLVEDVIGIRNEGTGAGQIGLAGNQITYGGVVVGFWAGGTAGIPLQVIFTGSANSTVIDALLQNITYANTSDTPTEHRTLVFTVTDSEGATNNGVLSGLVGNVTSIMSNGVAPDLGFDAKTTFADFDGDGDMDMVGGRGGLDIAYFENIGDASAMRLVARTGADNPLGSFGTYGNAPAAVDLDDDGDMDLVVGFDDPNLGEQTTD